MSSHLPQTHPDAGYTLDSTSSTTKSTSNGFTSHSPVLPVLSPSQIRQLHQQCMHERVQPQVPQQQQQHIQQHTQQSEPQLMQQEQQRQHPPRPMTKEEIAMVEFDRETEEAVTDLRRKRSKERAHKKLSMRMEYLRDAQEQVLQAMAEMDPTAKASITTTITTVSPSAPGDNATSSKLMVTTTATTTMGSAQVSQIDASSPVAVPVTFENNTHSGRQTPSRRASMPPLRIDTQSTSPPRTVAALSSLETLVDTPHFGMPSCAVSPAAFPFSSPIPSLDKKVEMERERSVLPSAGARSLLSPDSSYENRPSTAIAVASPTSAHSSGAKTVYSRKRKTTDVAAYKLGECLGRGGSAEVYRCKSNEDQKEYAIRIIPMKVVGDKIAEEVALMKKLCHPNIIEFKDFLHYKNLEWYMILELCNGELMKLQDTGKTDKVFSESECRDYFHQLLMGIEYLHEHNIIHKDIKPANILITHDHTLKIVDFGISQKFVTGEDMTIQSRGPGTVAFMAPELYSRGETEGRPTDIWSMGVTLFLMWNGEIPFHIVGATRTPNFEDPPRFKPGTPEPLRALLNKLLEKNPTKRITMDQMRDDMWVTDSGRKPLVRSKESNVGRDIVVTEADRRMAFKSIGVLFIVAEAARRFKTSLTRAEGKAVATCLARTSLDATSDVECNAALFDADRNTDAAGGGRENTGGVKSVQETGMDEDTSEEGGEFFTCQE